MPKKTKVKKTWTVVGYYPDNMQPYVDHATSIPPS